jgi:hypothetical protein
MATNDLPKITNVSMSIEVESKSWLGENQKQTIEIKPDKDGVYKAFAKVGDELTEDEKQSILSSVAEAWVSAQACSAGQTTITPVSVKPGDKLHVEIDFSDPHFQGLALVIPRADNITLLKVTYSRYTLKETKLERTDKETRLFFSVSDSLVAEKSPQGIMLDFEVRSKESPEYGIAKTSTVQVVAKGSALNQTNSANFAGMVDAKLI